MHKNASDDTRIYRLWLHIAHFTCSCVAMPETSYIIKEWENSRTAQDYTRREKYSNVLQTHIVIVRQV